MRSEAVRDVLFLRPRDVIRRRPPVSNVPAAVESRRDRCCFIVKDANGQALAYVYFEDEPERRATAGLLTYDEALSSRARLLKPLIQSSPKPVEAPDQFGRDELRSLLRVERSASNGDADNGAG